MKLRLFFCAAICIAIAMSALHADTFTFSGASMSGSMAKGKERTVLQGNARVVSGSVTITAQKIELYGTDFRYANCTGSVVIIDTEKGIKLTTENLFYDRIDKFARLTGPSVMEDSTNNVIVKGNYIENDDKNQIVIIKINARILRKDLACRAQFVLYNRATKYLELTGSPVVVRKGDEYRADKISVNLDTEDIILEGYVQGVIKQTTIPGDKTSTQSPEESSDQSQPPAQQQQSEQPQPPASDTSSAVPPEQNTFSMTAPGTALCSLCSTYRFTDAGNERAPITLTRTERAPAKSALTNRAPIEPTQTKRAQTEPAISYCKETSFTI
ncbi:MAG TPA: LptA/OstA family protein [Spirochaetia bacterium]|nr:LptA/OstA family protein [Spirochaetales bacterium]HRS65656.1 LptA/OstA family protein [Spirochaetia bacterium]HOT58356.1 LptA/OstA family protein [Spirochaetales bacterium]HPD80055.1 LptA/OstA family protein [Spirochaetales bacterium]HQK33678.1 LptA/OstA family protein [Spirochaetales bacterium]